MYRLLLLATPPFILLAFSANAAAPGADTEAFYWARASKLERTLLNVYFDLENRCRGSNELTACERRNAISDQLKAMGWCYGRKGQYGYQNEWHKDRTDCAE